MTDGDPVGEETVIDAMGMVRRIRDRHAAQLEGQTPAEVRAFFQREAAAANAKAERLLQNRRTGPNQASDRSKDVLPHSAP